MTAVGRVVTPINLRTVGADSLSIGTFRIACNERKWNQAAGEWADGDSLYMSVTCWRWLAERVAASLSIGDPVIVTGRLRSRQYEKDGRQNTVMELDASAVGPNLSWCTAAVTRPRKAAAAEPAPERVEAAVGA
jgi:single-strand DNA-binding protein